MGIGSSKIALDDEDLCRKSVLLQALHMEVGAALDKFKPDSKNLKWTSAQQKVLSKFESATKELDQLIPEEAKDMRRCSMIQVAGARRATRRVRRRRSKTRRNR